MFFALLVPVRILEGCCFLFLVYRRIGFDRAMKAAIVFWGIFASFGLDFLGIALILVAPGGAWIC